MFGPKFQAANASTDGFALVTANVSKPYDQNFIIACKPEPCLPIHLRDLLWRGERTGISEGCLDAAASGAVALWSRGEAFRGPSVMWEINCTAFVGVTSLPETL